MENTKKASGEVIENAGDAAPSRRAMLKTAAAAAVAASFVPASSPAQAEVADGFGAPMAEIHVPVGVLSAEQKGAMIRGVSDVLIRALNLPAAQMKYLWVQIIEVSTGGWGVGGQVFIPKNLQTPDGAPKG